MRNRICLFLTIVLLSFSGLNGFAQDIHFTQFTMSPLTLNPAYTGAFPGMWRVTGIYRNQWNSVTTPFVTFGGSVDAPLFRGVGQDDYLGGGLQFYNDRSGDGNLTNLSVLGSVAYHLSLDGEGMTKLSLGMQGGYTQKSIDLARLYFEDEFFNGGFQPGTTGEQLNPKQDYFTANVGLGWYHQVSDRIAYQLGVSAFNLNQPRETFLKKANNEIGLGLRVNGQLGILWQAGDKFSVAPAVMYQVQTAATELIAGTELKYILSGEDIPSVAPAVFVGGWYRNSDAAMITAGFQYQGFRLGFGYDYNMSDLKVASNGNGGFEVALTYIRPNPLDFAKRIAFPCARF